MTELQHAAASISEAATMRAYIYWNQDPELFSVGPFTVRWYGLLFALGFFLGYLIVRSVYRRENKPERDLDTLLVYMLLGTVIGARLGHVLFYNPGYYLSRPLEIVKVWEGGLASHGGAMGILIALYLYARKHPDQSFLWLLDRIAVPTALAGALIRLGNLFNSEIVGEPSDLPWAVVFARIDPLPRHPAQMYESLAYAAVFLVLMAVYRKLGKEAPRGLLLGLFLVAVFTARIFIEFVKVRQAAFGTDLALSMGQWLSLPFIIAGALLLAHIWVRSRSTRTSESTRPPSTTQ